MLGYFPLESIQESLIWQKFPLWFLQRDEEERSATLITTWDVCEFPIWHKEACICLSSFLILLRDEALLHLPVEGYRLDPVEGGGEGQWEEEQGLEEGHRTTGWCRLSMIYCQGTAGHYRIPDHTSMKMT